MRDKAVQELCGEGSNFFNLNKLEQGSIRKDDVHRYLDENPGWLVRWENGLADLSEAQRQSARPFACDLVASRVAIIWQSASAYARNNSPQEKKEGGRKRTRSDSEVKACEVCQCDLICPCCDNNQQQTKAAVFP